MKRRIISYFIVISMVIQICSIISFAIPSAVEVFESPSNEGKKTIVSESYSASQWKLMTESGEDFFDDIDIYMESNLNLTMEISENDGNQFLTPSNNYTMEVDESVYGTAPSIIDETSLRAVENDPENNGLRFKATITPEQRAAACEYGFLVASTDSLHNNNLELTFDISEITFKSGKNYSVEEGIDKYLTIDENGNYVFSMVLFNIPESAFVKNATARPYVIYKVDETEIIVYGNTFSNNLYRTAKDTIVTSIDEIEVEYAQSIVDHTDTRKEYLVNSIEYHFDDDYAEYTRIVCQNPDIDIIKITPSKSALYSVWVEGNEDSVTFEVLDEYGDPLETLMREEYNEEPVFLLEKGQDYYIRTRGNPETEYCCYIYNMYINDAIIWDFSSSSEGFEGGNGAVGSVVDGKLKIDIDKSLGSTAFLFKSYVKKAELALDAINYSRVIIRLKNETSTTKLDGVVNIDIDYNGSLPAINATLESGMLANMTAYKNIEFDFTTRACLVNSLELKFGEAFKSLSGNIYIDSIVILPMPELLCWDFETTDEGWSYNSQISSSSIQDGVLVLDAVGRIEGAAPAIISPNNSSSGYRYNELEIRVKNETSAENMFVYFSTFEDGHTEFNDNKYVSVEIEPNSSTFKTYVVKLYEHEFCYNDIKALMISIPGAGKIKIDCIKFRFVENDGIILNLFYPYKASCDCALEYRNDIDTVAFRVYETGSYMIRTASTTEVTGELYDANDNLLEISSKGPHGTKNFAIGRMLKAGEDYMLRIYGDDENETGKYRLSIYRIDEPTDTNFFQQWSLYNTENFGIDMNVLPVWEYTKGEGVTVAVLDTGVYYEHDDLASSLILPGKNVVHNNEDIFPSNESVIIGGGNCAATGGHGTHVSGIIAAQENGTGIVGVAPEAKILPVKCLGNGIVGTTSAGKNISTSEVILDGVEFAISQNVDVVNMSLGGSGYNYALEQIIDEADDILFVFSAGNDYMDLGFWNYYPASINLDNTITVAANNSFGELSYFSNYGGNVQISAPGSNILSTTPYEEYEFWDGTSMAAPNVAGIAALIRAFYPELTAAEVKSRIVNSENVTHFEGLSGKVQSNGMVNAWKAFNSETSISENAELSSENTCDMEARKSHINSIKNSVSNTNKTSRIFVKATNGSDLQKILSVSLAGYNYEIVNYFNTIDTYLVEFDSVEEADDAIDILNVRDDIEYSEPDYIVFFN